MGQKTRTRPVLPGLRDGRNCTLLSIERQVCWYQDCPSEFTCDAGNWTKWSTCSVTCGTGFRQRTRGSNMSATVACRKLQIQRKICFRHICRAANYLLAPDMRTAPVHADRKVAPPSGCRGYRRLHKPNNEDMLWPTTGNLCPIPRH